jgi:hypothetical protein
MVRERLGTAVVEPAVQALIEAGSVEELLAWLGAQSRGTK